MKLFCYKKKWKRLLYLTMMMFLVFGFQLQAQKIGVNGTIMNSEDNLPIPGVSVVIKGSNIGTISDFDGNYTINAKIGDVLKFSYLGMNPKLIKVTKREINVEMQTNLEDLDEVVVIGYGAIKKKEVTGAVSSIKAKDIEQIVTSDLGTALQGQMAGVNVISSSGEPGATSEILIRGITSVAGSNSPLYVVDGLIQDSDPHISPNEIETIDVLKDAASTAIYGTRGAAGVILITTKQGKAGSLSIRANATYGIQHLNGTPTRLMNANQQTYFDLVKRRSNLVPDDKNPFLGEFPTNKFQYDTNFFKNVVIDNQPVKTVSLNMSGGTKDITYSVTTGLFKKEGTLVKSNFERFNVRANTTYKHGKLDIKANVSISSEQRDFTPGALVNQIIRYQPNRQDLLSIKPDEVIVTETNGANDDTNRTGWVLESFENERTREDVNTQTNFSINYELFKGLKLTALYGYSTGSNYGHSFNPFREVVTFNGKNLSPSSSSSVGNSALKRKNQSFNTYATYKFNIKKDHNFILMGGFTFEDYHTEQFSAGRSKVLNNSIKTLNGTSENPNVNSGPDRRHKLQGVITRLQYNYKGKYLLSSSVRRDASSRFSPENRSHIFPSTALAWNISDEYFWAPLKSSINNFKLRTSYGEVGNESFGDYSYSPVITPNIDYVFGKDSKQELVNGATQTGFANSEVKWETSIQKNIGVDLGFFKNKITLVAEYYHKTNKDMLFPVTIPGSSGSTSKRTLNIGNMTNKGLEVALGYRTKIKKINVRMNGTFTTNKNKITKIQGLGGFAFTNDNGLINGDRNNSLVTTLAEGYEAGAFFLYPTDGIIKTDEQLQAYKNLGNPGAKLGDLIYRDTDDNGSIGEEDRIYSGSGLPEYEIGYSLNMDYKGFDMSMNWYAALGHEIMNGSKATAYAYGRHEDLVYQWSQANLTSNIPAFRGISKNHPNYRGHTDQWLEKGDYLRLKQVTLGYSLSKKIIKNLGVSRLRFYVSAQNPITLTKYTGYDPEIGGGISSRGLDKGNYPITSQYLAGLNLNF
ncbi:TonB-dependent receptor [Wenyingzhuangia sp. 2_MG-2023]|uniref:SusC/RagA family TonB-linked outer membrane protein n=1 Tax=Wenyingzhuangia sp. 2_MG-2023 TaxID=3062639 RepID=UPI0026E2107A|nr:TonB-dependent receptor [Wenyingzhuangia sp. 2_MG-2023]MDO6738727.1 TonB-dependent receptor [Wenyingzhuangia sp. 2_MG-2023]MDO6803010.1 TonB-dependent receptor [Wenyingzhuangia sp. 1_MG-2023]